MFAQTVGGADDLASAHSATKQQGATDLGPVVAAGILIDARGSTKFAPNHNRHILENTTDFEVVDKGAQCLVEFGAVIPHEVKVFAVTVPSAIT